MELRHLRYFLAVAEHGHITRAAEALGMQQPPLSQQIQALERELEVQLFRRLPRGVELTEAGRTLLADARGIMAQVEHARAATRRTHRGEQGRIAVGFTSSAPFVPFVPRVIRLFRETHALVSLALEETGTGELVEALLAERIDAAFIRSPIADPSGLVVHPLLSEEMVVALPSAHRLASGPLGGDAAIALAALAAETFILYRRPVGPGLYDTIIAACHAAGFNPQIGQEAPRIVSTLNLVAVGLGVSVVPISLRGLQMDGVVYRRLKGSPRPEAPLNLACRRGETSPAVRGFIHLVQRAAKDPGAIGAP
ncbi:MAG: LysR family transcriptional regulator [Proteobacteria bacterium]|nr:LysR family transcriptional regulator [Pseudomonadota bacterium]MBI3499589.1 LysR family transcriptional regulator [Pseudomonadota bacterium]